MAKQGETDGVEMVTRGEASEILKGGYPSDEQLGRFPLAHLLRSISDVDPRYGKQQDGKPGHIERVIKGMNILISEHPEHIVNQWATERPFQDPIVFQQTYQRIFGSEHNRDCNGYCRFNSSGEKDAFFRLLALYHDIGKAIITERHPLVGWHLVRDVHRDEVERKLYPLILGREYRDWRKQLEEAQGNVDEITSVRERSMLRHFGEVVRFHDYFGVMSTGEASLPLMLDLIALRGVDPTEAQESFSILVIFNLADVYGSVQEVLPQKVNVFCRDWRALCDTIADRNIHGDRSLFFDALREQTQTASASIERLWRLMYEGCPEEWRNEITHDKVEGVFKEATLSRMYPFINNYALFCKLDYCLGFKIMLMSMAKGMNTHLTVPVNAMICVLAELEKRYGDLCQRPDGTWRRIGFEMAGLTRRPTTHKHLAERKKSRIGENIVDLLLHPGGLGKEWAVSECTVWFMEE